MSCASLFGSEIEYLVILSSPRYSSKTTYSRFTGTLKNRLRGLTPVREDQLSPAQCREEVASSFSGATDRPTLIVELFELQDGFVDEAQKFLEQEIRCDLRGIVTLFGTRSRASVDENNEQVPRTTLFAMRLTDS